MLARLEADRARVAELQTQILHLERSLSKLRIEKTRTQERLDSYTYPVLSLPNELVSEIFVHTLPPYPDFPDLIGPFSPTPLSQICRRWREVALATPELWSALSSLDNNRHGQELRIFELWLERSRHCPLSINLWPDVGWASDELVDAVIPHRARWQYLKIDLGVENLRILDGPMPLLRHLEVALADGTPESVSLHEVPLLRTVALDDVAALRVVLPWAQLTSLTLLNVYPSECVPILIQAHSLVHCELDLCFDEFGIGPRRDITLPYLESLVFTDAGGSATDLLPTLIIPALRNLKIPESFLASNPVESLTALISKTGGRLKELHLTGQGLLPQMSYRHAFPFLRRLWFGHWIPNDGEDSTDPASAEG
ncbi:hypothetical protein DFH06DRAFT_758251 [Mycena polygramma]|nr:hypothetical protein DFH06DRAFT_758251 [Mycena polygramma]